MNDEQIVSLFWERDESAIREAQSKYGAYCLSVATRILDSREDAEECVNDAFLGAWNAIPPYRPAVLSAFLGKITRRLCLKKLRDGRAVKRGGGAFQASYEELESCISLQEGPDDLLETAELTRIINAFLKALPETERRVFVCRYWYYDPIEDIADRFGFGKSKVKMMLKRTRDKLAKRLREEGYPV